VGKNTPIIVWPCGMDMVNERAAEDDE